MIVNFTLNYIKTGARLADWEKQKITPLLHDTILFGQLHNHSRETWANKSSFRENIRKSRREKIKALNDYGRWRPYSAVVGGGHDR